MKIAIIGAGVSGLVCAHLLNKKYDVTLFEKNDYFGGHAHTIEAKYRGKSYNLDTGFLVYNEPGYPNFTKLLKKLNVATIPSDMSFSVSDSDRDFEYNGHDFLSLFSQKSNLYRPKFYKLLYEIVRFNKHVKKTIATDTAITLAEFIKSIGFDDYFLEYYLRPMIASIWSANPDCVFDFPLLFLGRFFDNHGLLNIMDRPQWRTILGGSKQYVSAIMNQFTGLVIAEPVMHVSIKNNLYTIATENGMAGEFDAIIMATHSDEAIKIFPDMPVLFKQPLEKIGYQDNEVILHTDSNLMPRRKKTFASWNYKVSKNSQRATLTYYINKLQNIQAPCEFLITLNQSHLINPNLILEKFNYAHPVFNIDALKAQQSIRAVNGQHHLYLAGAYLHNGFHEDGVQSALDVCKHFGIDDI